MKRAEVGIKFNSISLELSGSKGLARTFPSATEMLLRLSWKLTIGRQLQPLWDIAVVQGLSGNIGRLSQSQQRCSQHPGKML